MTFMTFTVMRLFLLALNLHMPLNRWRSSSGPTESIELEFTLNREKKKERRVQVKFKKRKKFVKGRIPKHMRSTKPKDARFSNQHALRRMYRST